MSKQRYINTRFWDDGYIVTLDPIEKLLFIYFITNPLTEICGAYEIPLRRIAYDTGIDRDMVLKILGRFADADKIIYRDEWIFICNFIKHQTDSAKINTGIAKLVKCCPDWIKDRVSISYGYRIDMPSHSIEIELNRDRDESVFSETQALPPEKEKRGTRINANFKPDEDMRKWADAKFPTYDVDGETEKFVNYWLGASGRNASKLDWNATWRNWFINEKQPVLKKVGSHQKFLSIDVDAAELEWERSKLNG